MVSKEDLSPAGRAGNVRTQCASAVLVLLFFAAPLTAQTTGKSEGARSFERSGQLLFERGVLLYQREGAADKREALSLFVRAAEDFNAAGAVGKQATAMLLAGFASKSLSQDREALGFFKNALLLFQKAKHHPGEIDALTHIGIAHYHLGELDEALEQLNQALELSRKLRERRGAANALCVIAQVYIAKKELQRAIDVYKEALPMLRALDDRDAETRAVNNLQLITAELNQQKSRN